MGHLSKFLLQIIIIIIKINIDYNIVFFNIGPGIIPRFPYEPKAIAEG